MKYAYIQNLTDGRRLGTGNDSDIDTKIEVARDFGLLIHNEYEEQDGPGGATITRDDWYCASPEWVADYHANGGLWPYTD